MSTTLIGPRKEKAGSPALPAQLFPARVKLVRALSDYEASGMALAESEAHLERSKADEQAALNNLELSDQQSADAVAFAQRAKGVYLARVSSRQSAQTRLLGELSAAVRAAQGELSSAVYQELAKRRAILLERIRVAGQLEGQVWAEALDSVLESSRPIGDVQQLEVPAQALLVDGSEIKVGLARRILDNYIKLTTERERTI